MSTFLTKVLFAFAIIGILACGFVGGFAAKQFFQPTPQLPDILNADTASGGKFLSVATGWIDDDGEVEGLFVLDHMTGTLYCWVINPRTGALGASLSTNVGSDLAVDGKAGDTDYVLVTGYCKFSRQTFSGPAKPARTVVYVGEGNTGRVAAYMIRFQGRVGKIERLGVGQTRDPSRIRQ